MTNLCCVINDVASMSTTVLFLVWLHLYKGFTFDYLYVSPFTCGYMYANPARRMYGRILMIQLHMKA